MASMGPRSVERGKHFRSGLAAPLKRLQWGRVLLNAESRRQSANAEGINGLQWGRVLLNAESQ